ncbi:MAG: hypothetical protein OQK44_06535, partial [Gammaproteobacteria bacterium]|nr:hypothetical protein [Gammaproteobacteria bacterium]
NYLIQIVKEHLFSQKKSPCLTMTDSAQQRSGSLAVVSTNWQALFITFLSFFSVFEKQSRSLNVLPSRRAGILHIIVNCVHLFFKNGASYFFR